MSELSIKQRLVNYYYFVIFNSILACIIGIGYWFRSRTDIVFQLPELDILYIITTHFTIICLIVFVISLTILPTIYLKPKKARLAQLVLFGLLLAILVCDVRVFQVDQVHIFSVTIDTFINIITTSKAIFTINKAIACIGLIVLLRIIYKTQQWIDKTNYLTNNKIGAIFILLVLTLAIISVLSYQLATKEKQQQFLVYMQYLPFNDKNKNLIKNMYKMVENNKLQYPLNPLQITKVTNPPNILIIAMDAWRADCFNEIDSPNLWQLAKQGIVFNNHFSGGNHTKSGLFSLFYGIPAIYRYRFKKQHTVALLFSRLEQLNYRLNINTYDQKIKKFIKTNQQLYFINRNIGVSKIDQQITDNWIQNYNNLDKTNPWFSFVFYNSLHDLYFPENYSTKIKSDHGEYKEIVNKYGKDNFIVRYKTTVHYIDSLANQILTHLEESNDLENTIVIITADHGCEWNDNNQGQWGYWSNFTDCQVKVPLAIILPKQYQNKLINQQDNLTTHYDIVPTLMHNFLGVTNNITDYSIGNDLFNNKQIQDWCLACSSAQYDSCSSAIIANDNALKIYPSGILNHIDNFNRLMFNKKINQDYLNQALEYITRFIKK